MKKVSMPKKLKGDPLVSTGNVCYAEKMKDVFGSGNWGNLKFCRTILVTSGVSKKTLTKSHDYSRFF